MGSSQSMDQGAARRLLGVPEDAASTEVLVAYGRLSRRLKRRLVEAATVEGRDDARRALRSLVLVRDAALGARDAEDLRSRRAAERRILLDDWWRPEDGVPVAASCQADALRWLGVGTVAALPTIRRVLDARARQVKMRIARAATEYDLHVWQQTLVDLRRMASLALGSAGGTNGGDVEETATESPPRR